MRPSSCFKSRMVVISVAVVTILALRGAGAALEKPQGNAGDYNPLGMLVSHTAPGTYRSGQPVEVMVTIRFVSAAEGITALGFTEEIPPGWMFQSMGSLVSGLLPTITPQPGAQDVLGFAWITIPPEFPYQFSYFLMPGEDAAGQQTISGQGEYRLTAGRLQSDADIIILNGKDGTPPRITLLGENPMTIEQGDPYVEPGYTATDNVDGNVTNRVQVSGQVNSEVIGSYTLTYAVSDAAGNAATPAVRTVIVVRPADEGGSGGTPGGSGGSSGPRPRPRRGNYGGYGYYPGQDYVDPATQQPLNPANAQQPQPLASATNPNPAAPGTPPFPVNPAGIAQPGGGMVPEGGMISPGNLKIAWPTPDGADAQEATATPVSGAPKEGTPAEPAVAATTALPTPEAPQAEASPALAATTAPAADNTGAIAATQLATPNTGAVAVSAPAAPGPPRLGPVEQMGAALAKMGTADWLRLGIVLAVFAMIGVLAGVAWRGAYSPPPRRKTSNGTRN